MCVSIVFKAALCFGSDLALKTIDKHMFFWAVFENTQKKLLTGNNAILTAFGG